LDYSSPGLRIIKQKKKKQKKTTKKFGVSGFGETAPRRAVFRVSGFGFRVSG